MAIEILNRFHQAFHHSEFCGACGMGSGVKLIVSPLPIYLTLFSFYCFVLLVSTG